MMMTTNRLIDAASMIARSINRDLDNRPNFTLTRDQLNIRIATYLDCPHDRDDELMIAAYLTSDPAMPLR